MKTKSKMFIGILLFVIAIILGLLTVGNIAANGDSGVYSSLVVAIPAIILLIAGIWLMVSNVKLAKND